MITLLYLFLIPGHVGFSRRDGGFRLIALPWPIALGEYLYHKYFLPTPEQEEKPEKVTANTPELPF